MKSEKRMLDTVFFLSFLFRRLLDSFSLFVFLEIATGILPVCAPSWPGWETDSTVVVVVVIFISMKIRLLLLALSLNFFFAVASALDALDSIKSWSLPLSKELRRWSSASQPTSSNCSTHAEGFPVTLLRLFPASVDGLFISLFTSIPPKVVVILRMSSKRPSRHPFLFLSKR